MRLLRTLPLCLLLPALSTPAFSQATDLDCLTDRETPMGVCQVIEAEDDEAGKVIDKRPVRSVTYDARGGWMRDTYDFVSRNDAYSLGNFGLYANR